ncbi:hypothetical protein K504DRAFT_468469 [Pleomassaria siparia CBS 279.74]|uniref:F-box domain-containing protein n=1 Tax=Pleomassaria siparia CBS 279.74 TaxID=1314801 RepID=A0A6G1K6K6_9PLEO|nr:hypothetical protein K504DRAFT_468469 [Pleomassaria siparia CBS 279.74]
MWSCDLCLFVLGSSLVEISGHEEGPTHKKYNPDLIDKDDLDWLDKYRALGWNTEEHKTFVSGPGVYGAPGIMHVPVRGADEPSFNVPYYVLYNNHEDRWWSYAFHDACYDVLLRSVGKLGANPDPMQFDTYVMYHLMHSIETEGEPELEKEEKLESLKNEPWSCVLVLGEEYVTWNPSEKASNLDNLKTVFQSPKFTCTPESRPLTTTTKVSHDPFTALHYDILHLITQQLSTPDIFSLIHASPYIYRMTDNPTFWKHMMGRDIFPWFWEAMKLINGCELPEHFDYKGAYLWMDKVVRPKFGMTGPWMGVANRRRIWKLCVQLADSYHKERDAWARLVYEYGSGSRS